MPSPFPGMDPYLEGSEWTSVHAELSSEIVRQLAPKLVSVRKCLFCGIFGSAPVV